MSDGHTMTVGSLGRALGRRWLTMVSSALLGVLLGAGAQVALPSSYAASAVVVLGPVTSTPSSTGQVSSQVNMASERSTALSTTVSTRAAEGLPDRPYPAALRDALDVSVPTGSGVLRFTVTADDPARSAAWANALAKAYLEYRSEAAGEAGARIVERIQADLNRILSARATAGEADRALFDQEIQRQRQRQYELSSAPVNPGTVVSDAEQPSVPVTPRRVFLVAGLALGLLIGAAVALWRDRREPTVRDPQLIRDALPGAVVCDDDEPLRQARRILAFATGDLGPWSERDEQRRVVVCSWSDTGSSALAAALRREVREWGLSAEVVDEMPVRAGSGSAHAVRSVAESDVVVLVVDRDTRRRDVQDVVDFLALAGRAPHYVAYRPRAGWVGSPVPVSRSAADDRQSTPAQGLAGPGEGTLREVSGLPRLAAARSWTARGRARAAHGTLVEASDTPAQAREARDAGPRGASR